MILDPTVTNDIHVDGEMTRKLLSSTNVAQISGMSTYDWRKTEVSLFEDILYEAFDRFAEVDEIKMFIRATANAIRRVKTLVWWVTKPNVWLRMISDD